MERSTLIPRDRYRLELPAEQPYVGEVVDDSLTVAQAIAPLGWKSGDGEIPVAWIDKTTKSMRHSTLDACADTSIIELGNVYAVPARYRPGSITVKGGRSRANVVEVFELSFDADLKDYLNVPKEALFATPHDQLDAYIEALVKDVKEVCHRVGIPWHRITCTGYGILVSTRLDDDDQRRVDEIHHANKQLVERANRLFGGTLFDPAVVDPGTRLTRIPGSLNHKGPTPRQTRIMDEQSGTVRLNDLSVEPLKHVASAPIDTTPLTEEAMREIVSLGDDLYNDGDRHAVALGLSALLAKAGAPEEQAAWVIEELADDDEEIADRLRAVSDTYRKAERGLPISGYRVLTERFGESNPALTSLCELLDAHRRRSGSDSTEAAGTPQTPKSRLRYRKLSAVTAKSIEWMWHGWLARGKFHLLAGLAGDGKSTIAAALAAIGSKGGQLPDGAIALPFRTLFVLGEDGVDDTLLPRVALHHGDIDHIFALDGIHDGEGRERYFNVEKHLDLLEDMVKDERIDLIVIDPLTTFMAGKNRNDEGDVRDSLTPLVKMAERRAVAVLGIAHVGKPNGTARTAAQRVLGSTGFTAMARIVWQTAEADAGVKALGVTKTNLTMKPSTLLWSREEDGPIEWDGVSTKTIDALMNEPRGSTPRADAKEFLMSRLAPGPARATDICEEGRERGFAQKTIERAKADLGIESFRNPPGYGAWDWRLPDTRAQDDELRLVSA